ncbi:MAG TPA: sialidase family protein, partial [Rubricoccaceae bacterium]|nr:sialidase family protein [Rubricoccaceae bacterium]
MPSSSLWSMTLAVGLMISLAAPAPVPAASAQELTWERVGDVPIDAESIDFGPDGTLWAIGPPLHRLLPGGSVWEQACDQPGSGCYGDHVLALSPDTVVWADRYGARRSLDGGETWAAVFDGGGVLWEAARDGPNAGLLLAGTTDSVGTAYSTDRGATWTRASIPGNNVIAHDATAFAEFPHGHPHAGRLLASAYGGLRYSDDGGATWHKSNIYDDFFRYGGGGVAVAADGRAWATLGDGTLPNTQRYVSDDGAA